MQLDDEVGPFVEPPRHAFRRGDRPAPRRPAHKRSFGILRVLERHPVEAGLPILSVAPARRRCPIDADHRVVDRRAVGLELHGADEDAGAQGRPQHEIAIHVVGAGLDVVRTVRRENDIGLTELPPARPHSGFGRSDGRPSAIPVFTHL